jgi:hypothetical protein
MPVKSWFNRLFSRDRRQAERHKSLPLVAFYWDGAEPVPRAILDVSLNGMYLLTQQRWYPGTVVTMTLQRAKAEASDPERAIAVSAKVVRSGKDGVGLQFVQPLIHDSRGAQSYRTNDANVKTIRSFFNQAHGDMARSG